MKLGNIYYIKYQLHDLEGGAAINNEQLMNKLRKNTEILIIDDNEFAYLDSFKTHGFSVSYKSDISTFVDIKSYDVILCDIRGVGKMFNSQYEGAYLIKEIKELYPSKTIIAYTASDYDPKYTKYLNYADNIIAKGTALEDWVAILDKTLRDFADPAIQWKKMREALLDANVDTIMVAELENKYVDAVKKSNFSSLKQLSKEPNNDMEKILANFLSTIFVKIIEGVL